MAFKVWVATKGDKTLSTNAITHDTVDEAVAYAKDLHGRWMAVMDWYVVPKSADLVGHISEAECLEHAVHRMSGAIEGAE